MAVIRKSDLGKMTEKEFETKRAELERSLLELEGEGKREKRKPVKKAIAQIKTKLSQKKQLNTASVQKNVSKKSGE
jgi:ribosomal protein L29